MGSKLSRRINRYVSRNERRILIVGLDGAGKTTILNKMRGINTSNNSTVASTTLPTAGFNVERIEFQKLILNIWDVGGQDTLRPYWRHHFTGTQGIIFVVDSADISRLNRARNELLAVLNDAQLLSCPILILINKQDLESAMSLSDITTALNFTEAVKGRQFHVEPTIATTGDGLEEGFLWLCNHMGEL